MKNCITYIILSISKFQNPKMIETDELLKFKSACSTVVVFFQDLMSRTIYHDICGKVARLRLWEDYVVI